MILRTSLVGVITTYPPQIPATLTARLKTPTTVFEAATVTLDAVSTTVSAASEGATELTVASATGIVTGRRYRVGKQTIIVDSISGTAVTLTEPLATAAAASETFLGLAATIPVTVAHTADEGFGVVQWTSDLDVWSQSFEIRDQTAQAYTLTGPALTSRLPLVADLRAGTDPDYREMIQAGWYRLKRDLDAQQIDPALIRNWEGLEGAHAHACVVAAMIQSPRYDQDARDTWEAEYQMSKASAFANRSAWYDEDNDFAKSEDEGFTVRKSWSL